jgi:hypothetical protein
MSPTTGFVQPVRRYGKLARTPEGLLALATQWLRSTPAMATLQRSSARGPSRRVDDVGQLPRSGQLSG